MNKETRRADRTKKNHYKSAIIWIVLTAVSVAILGGVRGIVERSYSTVNRKAAIATVNGGEVEFANVQTAKEAGKMIDGIFILAIIGIAITGAFHVAKEANECRKEIEEKQRLTDREEIITVKEGDIDSDSDADEDDDEEDSAI